MKAKIRVSEQSIKRSSPFRFLCIWAFFQAFIIDAYRPYSTTNKSKSKHLAKVWIGHEYCLSILQQIWNLCKFCFCFLSVKLYIFGNFYGIIQNAAQPPWFWRFFLTLLLSSSFIYSLVWCPFLVWLFSLNSLFSVSNPPLTVPCNVSCSVLNSLSPSSVSFNIFSFFNLVLKYFCSYYSGLLFACDLHLIHFLLVRLLFCANPFFGSK